MQHIQNPEEFCHFFVCEQREWCNSQTRWLEHLLEGQRGSHCSDFSVLHSIWIGFKWQNCTLKCLLFWKFSRQMGIKVQISTNRTRDWTNFYLSVSHYNTVKKHWPASASSFGKFFSEFISDASFSLKVCEKKKKHFFMGWNGTRELWS